MAEKTQELRKSVIQKRRQIKCTGTFHPRTGHQGPGGEKRYSSAILLNSELDRGGWSTPRFGRFIHVKDSLPIVQEDGWTPGIF